MRDDSLQQVTRSWNIEFIERKSSNSGAVKRTRAVGNLTLVVQEEITAQRLMIILSFTARYIGHESNQTMENSG